MTLVRAEAVRLALLAALEALPWPVERNRQVPVQLDGELEDGLGPEELPRAILRDGTLEPAEPPTLGPAATYFHRLSARLELYAAGATVAEIDAQVAELVETLAVAIARAPQLCGPGSYARAMPPRREDTDERGIAPGAAAELDIVIEYQSQSPAG